MTDTAKPKRTRKFARVPKNEASSQTDAPRTMPDPSPPTEQADPPAAKPESKTGRMVSFLQRPEGATLEEMVAATGWQPHTTRAALTGLRKKGHAITSEKIDGVRRYRAAASL